MVFPEMLVTRNMEQQFGKNWMKNKSDQGKDGMMTSKAIKAHAEIQGPKKKI